MRALVPIARPESDPALRQRSSVATLAAAGMLDADQVEAAWRFASLWHEMVDGISAYDLILGIERPTTERAIAAKQRLQQIRNELGGHGFELVIRVAVEGFSLQDLFVGRRPRDTHADMLRVHLHEIALMLRHDAPPNGR